MNILLTGGSGFIGAHLKAHLEMNHTVHSPSSSELNLEDVESVDQFFNGKYFDAVVHAAGKGRDNVNAEDFGIMKNIISSFMLLYAHQKQYGKFINFGSGAEFDLDKNINNVSEEDVLRVLPASSYGYAKNYVARFVEKQAMFYNLRLFSCFGPGEADNRLLAKFVDTINKGQHFNVDKDRYVDFVSIHDICTVVDAVLDGTITDRDINVVYQNKLKVSEILNKYCKLHHISNTCIAITGIDDKNYTGNGSRLAKYNLPLEGLDAGLEKYRRK